MHSFSVYIFLSLWHPGGFSSTAVLVQLIIPASSLTLFFPVCSTHTHSSLLHTMNCVLDSLGQISISLFTRVHTHTNTQGSIPKRQGWEKREHTQLITSFTSLSSTLPLSLSLTLPFPLTHPHRPPSRTEVDGEQ